MSFVIFSQAPKKFPIKNPKIFFDVSVSFVVLSFKMLKINSIPSLINYNLFESNNQIGCRDDRLVVSVIINSDDVYGSNSLSNNPCAIIILAISHHCNFVILYNNSFLIPSELRQDGWDSSWSNCRSALRALEYTAFL